jgi:hypothetical protein
MGMLKESMDKDRIVTTLTMVGHPVDVGKLSIKKHETNPIIVRFECCYPECIKGTM